MGEGLQVTIQLQSPIKHGEDLLTELTLTEPDLGSLMALDEAKGNMSQTLYTICACTALPPSVIKQIRMRDLKTIGEAAAQLMGEESRETGAKRAPGSRISSAGRLAS